MLSWKQVKGLDSARVVEGNLKLRKKDTVKGIPLKWKWNRIYNIATTNHQDDFVSGRKIGKGKVVESSKEGVVWRLLYKCLELRKVLSKKRELESVLGTVTALKHVCVSSSS